LWWFEKLKTLAPEVRGDINVQVVDTAASNATDSANPNLGRN
jgi:hypothetical protein